MDPVYLDNNATTRVDAEVVAAMMPYFTEQFGNASSGHQFGARVAEAVREARRQVQSLLGAAREQEIVFTSGGTEADNTAIQSAVACMAEAGGGRTEIVTTAVEHPAVLAVCAHLEQSRGVRVHRIGVDRAGRLDMAAYRQALGPKTALVSVMWANNETGMLFPIAELARLAHEAGALFHTDAVQAVGRIRVDVQAAGVDMLSLSGHKLHGPKGIGALYLKKGVPFRPLIWGGHQERARRAGTENVPGIVGLGRAAQLAERALADEQTRVRGLRDAFEQAVLQRIDGCRINGDPDSRLPNTASIAFEGAEGEAVVIGLDKAGIAASLGSACAAGRQEPSHVLTAMGVPAAALAGSLRFSFSRQNDAAEVERVLDVLPAIVARARRVGAAQAGAAMTAAQ